jgi:YVTN family beta-propeller protein
LIHSAGEVIRFGKPELENHALAVAQLSIDGKVVVEDRYGLLIVDANTKTILQRWNYTDLSKYKQCMSTYSGIRSFTDKNKTYILWTAVDKNGSKGVLIMAEWADGQLRNFTDLPIPKISEATSSIPNDIWVSNELGENFIYIVLNGNNELLKINFSTQQIIWKMPTGVAPYGITKANNQLYVSNWAGETATDPSKERAGVPWGLAYTNPKTGATASGTVSVINPTNGKQVQEIKVGLHPNAVVSSKDGKFVYVSNGSSDVISVISTKTNTVVETIGVGLLQGKNSLQGSTPNALTLSADQSILYVANGMDNAIAVVQLSKNSSSYGKGKSIVAGYIPTEAYPGGVEVVQNQLVVANIESNGANVVNASNKARSIHSQLASISIIPIPNKTTLVQYTQEAAQLSMANLLTQLAPRPGIAPVPVPERLGEPSVFKHVVYIIKENKTYDQVFGDMPKGKNDSTLCVFGAKITPNIHALAKQYGWMDDYYASGKSSAEGHQWTDAGMVSDYVEKAVRAWFRSYPHRQADALVYNQAGFIWNHALDHGKSVRVFGEACETKYNRSLKWADLYKNYQEGKAPNWTNQSTIARLLPIISPTYPDCDNISFSDQQRADIFIQEWKQYEQNNTLPNLMVISLPNDHTSGTSPDFPTPNAMVADNDLAVGRIIEMISKSKYYDSTVVFITQDDSQSGWDHISAYRTVGLTISPYSSGKLVSTNYNQVSMLRTIEQILGIPPMNIMDATARTMTDCFQLQKNSKPYIALSNNIPLNQMNKGFNVLNGKAKKYAKQSQQAAFKEVDGGDDDAMNRILWFYAKGSEKYPQIH